VTGLTPGTGYKFRVSAINAEGTGTASTRTRTVAQPDTPETPKVTGNTTDSVSLSWTEPDNGDSPVVDYKIEYCSDGTTWTVFNDGTERATATTVTGLTRGTTYRFRVSAINATGTSIASPASSSIVTALPPAPPEALRVTGLTSASVSLSWTAPDDGASPITDYRIEYLNYFYSPIWVVINDGVSSATSATVTGLIRSSSYTFRVSAINSAGTSNASTYSSSVIPANAPAAPTAPRIAGKTTTSISLTWTAPESGGSYIFDYKIEFNSGGTIWTIFNDGTSGTTTATVTGLTRGTTYTFRISAINGAGTSTASPASSSVITVTAPSAPSPPTITGKTFSSVSISWTAPDDGGRPITDYRIEYFTTIYGPSLAIFSDGVSTATSVTVTGLIRGASYTFRVSAINAEGTSNASTYSSSVIPARTPAAPTAPTIAGRTNTSISLTWNAPDDGGRLITDYKIEFSSDGTTWAVFNDGTSGTTAATVTGLTRGTAYTFRISAINAEGTSTASPASSSAIAGTTPAAPATPMLTSKTPTSVSLSWTAPENNGKPITDYKVEYSSDGTTWIVFNDGTSTSTSATVSGLVPGTSYRFRISAINSVGTGTSSTPTVLIIAATAPQTPNAPTVVITGTTGGRVTVSWIAPANGGVVITGYEVTATGGATPIVKTITNVATLSQAFTGLSPTTSYRFTVKATNAIGTSAASPGTSLVPAAVPAKPDSVAFVSAGNGSISVAYTAPASNGGSAITGYLVQAFTPSTTSAVISSCQSNATTLTCTVTGLTNGVRYELRVYAKNIAGASTAFSKLVNVKAGAAPAAPRSRL
jgi:titin